MTATQFDQARQLLQASERVAVFSGAGLSAESGLSTFRDPDPDSLWSRFDPKELASIEGFEQNPQRVIEWYQWRRQTHANVKPNAAHHALAAHPALIHITQNVDHLLEQAGVAAENIYHLHGTIKKDRCHNPDCDYEEAISLDTAPGYRPCPECNHVLRPAVVWFGEALPEQAWLNAQQLCTQIDCLLVIGTSATVYPAAGLIQLAKQYGSKIIVLNKDSSEASGLADVELIGNCAGILPSLFERLLLSSH